MNPRQQNTINDINNSIELCKSKFDKLTKKLFGELYLRSDEKASVALSDLASVMVFASQYDFLNEYAKSVSSFEKGIRSRALKSDRIRELSKDIVKCVEKCAAGYHQIETIERLMKPTVTRSREDLIAENKRLREMYESERHEHNLTKAKYGETDTNATESHC